MKKLILIGITVGIAGLAQATDITLNPGNAIDGTYAYLYQASISLSAGQTISSATLYFNNITLTSSGSGHSISSDLINLDNSYLRITDSDAAGDYFQSHSPYSTDLDALGTKSLTQYVTQSWSYTFNSTQLGELNADVTTLGGFDIGIDPDCYFTVGSIVFSYDTRTTGVHTPDQAATVGLLGMSVLGLLAFRRKLALQ